MVLLIGCGEPRIVGEPPPFAGQPGSESAPPSDTPNVYDTPRPPDLSTPDPIYLTNISNAEPGKVYTATATLKGFYTEIFVSADGASDIVLNFENARRQPPELGGYLVSPGWMTVTMSASRESRGGKEAILRIGDSMVRWAILTMSGDVSVGTPTSCVQGYCKAWSEGCHADPALAAAYCTHRGFTDSDHFTTVTKDGAEQQCNADGSECTTLDTCGLVFDKISCR